MKITTNSKIAACIKIFAIFLFFSSTLTSNSQTVVDRYGQLSVDGNNIVASDGTPVQLRGMSLFWSQWHPEFYNYDCIKWLRDDWNIKVIRAAMAVEHGGYLENPEDEKEKIKDVINAAIDLGIYVIIDWHDHNADQNQDEAISFFSEMASLYSSYPNIIYETWNEPENDTPWLDTIKPYHESVVNAIRFHDNNNIIILGTEHWSQYVDEASLDPLDGENLVYALHYYAASHKEEIRNRARIALDNDIALFVSEYGTTEYTGDGIVDEEESREWWDFLNRRMISHVNWSITDKNEASAALLSNASSTGGWDPDIDLSESGILVRNELRDRWQQEMEELTSLNKNINPSPGIYPSYVSEKLYISSYSQIDKLEIYSIDGKKVKSTENVKNVVNVSSLKPGIYIVKTIDKNNSAAVSRIIKK